MKKLDVKKIPLTSWQLPIGFVVMMLAVLITQKNKLFDIEQTRVFVYYGELILQQIAPVGGVADMVALWMQQFFKFPVAGAAFMAALYTLIAWMLGDIMSRMGYKSLTWRIVAWLPAVVLYVYTENRIFFTTGHSAMLISVFGLWVYSVAAEKSKVLSRIAILVLIPLVGWSASTCVWAMVASMLVVSLFRHKDYLSAAEILLVSVTTIVLAMHFCLAVNSMELFSPDIYNMRTKTDTVMILVWIATALVLLLPLISKRFAEHVSSGKYAVVAVLIVLAAGAYLYNKNHDEQAEQRLAMLRMFAVGDYDGVANFCANNLEYYYTANYFCMVRSMNENDDLAGLAGTYLTDPKQLIMDSSEEVIIRQLMMNVYYHIGYVAGAQCQAFEWNEPTEGMMRPSALQILAKTNIIQGHYAVAEKYLDHLAHTLFYKEWAEKYRKFLYNDKAVETDIELGRRRKAVGITNGPGNWTTAPLLVREITRVSPNLPSRIYLEAYKKLRVYDSYEYKK